MTVQCSGQSGPGPAAAIVRPEPVVWAQKLWSQQFCGDVSCARGLFYD